MHLRSLLTCLLAVLALVAALATAAAAAAADRRVPADGDGRVLVAPLTGAVDPVMLEFVERVLGRAEADGYDAVGFELDTPGGLSTSMDDIVRRIVGADDLPVYVLVGPDTARAASAGVFITYASDVAAMAPGTNIGSATPISGSGEELPEDLRKKVVNDAVASIVELAKERGRDEQFAEEAITEADNIGAREALERGVVEYLADDVRDLLEQSDDTTVEPKGMELHLANAETERMEPPLTLRVLKRLIDPNILLLLFGAGVIGLGFELTHPGSILPGVAGGISMLLAMYGLSILPATGAGIALLVLAAALFAAEAVAPGGGLLGAGGAAALLVGSLLLFDDSSGYGVSPWLAVGMALAFFAFFSLVLSKVLETRGLQPATGSEGLVGMTAQVRRAISDDEPGLVHVDGELWRARPAHEGQAFVLGERVQVVRMDGMDVEVDVVATERAGDRLPDEVQASHDVGEGDST